MASIAWADVSDAKMRAMMRLLDPDKSSPITTLEYARMTPDHRALVDNLVQFAYTKGLAIKPRTRTVRIDRASEPLAGHSALPGATFDPRAYTEISSSRSEGNLITPLLSESLSPSPELSWNHVLLKTIDEAKKFIVVEGYELDREDLVDRLIEKARQGVAVAVLFDPANTEDEHEKSRLLAKMRQANLSNLTVAEYVVAKPGNGRAFEQILHIKRVIADTPDGTVCEVSGGVNFNTRSMFHFDSGWRTEGLAALDALQHALEHFLASGVREPFELKLVPKARTVKARMKAKVGKNDVGSVVEIAGAGRRPLDTPVDYTLKELRERAQLGKRIVVSSEAFERKGVASLLRLAVVNGSAVTVVVEALSADDKAELQKVKKELPGVQFIPAHAMWKESSYERLVERELVRAIENRESIDVAAFALSQNGVLQRLIEAKRAGCPVRVMLDDLSIEGNLINGKAMALLTQAGIEVRGLDAATKQRLASERAIGGDPPMLHAKLILIGGKRVLGGSANFSSNGFANNVEEGRLVESTDVAKCFSTRLFEPLWAEARPVTPHTLVEDATRIALVPHLRTNTPIEETVFVVTDLETTGLRPEHGQRILQISAQAFRIRGGQVEVLKSFNHYVTPGRNPLGGTFEIPSNSTSIHHITPEVLSNHNARPLRDVLGEFTSFMQEVGAHGPVVLAGQNVAFDLRYLDHVLAKEDLAMPSGDGSSQVHYRLDCPYIDTQELSARLFPDAEEHDLDAIMQRLEVPKDASLPRHDAWGDVVYTGKALAALIERGRQRTVGELLIDDHVRLVSPAVMRDIRGRAVCALELSDKGKLRVSAPGDRTTSKAARRVEVRDCLGPNVEVEVIVGRGDKEKRHLGLVPLRALTFTSGGRVYFKLKEGGQDLPTPKILTTRI